MVEEANGAELPPVPIFQKYSNVYRCWAYWLRTESGWVDLYHLTAISMPGKRNQKTILKLTDQQRMLSVSLNRITASKRSGTLSISG